MSHFTKLGVNFKQQNEQDLIKALQERFGEEGVEVSETGAELHGYGGTIQQGIKANIIVRAKALNKGGRADMGFERTKDGGYVLHTDAAYFNNQEVGKLTQEYGYMVAERRMKAQGYMVKRQMDKSGKLKAVCTKYV